MPHEIIYLLERAFLLLTARAWQWEIFKSSGERANNPIRARPGRCKYGAARVRPALMFSGGSSTKEGRAGVETATPFQPPLGSRAGRPKQTARVTVSNRSIRSFHLLSRW